MSQSAHAPIPMTGGQFPALGAPSPFFSVRVLRAVSFFAEAHRWILFAAVSFACAWGHINGMAARHLDHDELFTFYIAQAPTVGQLLKLTRTIDLHPPLSYLLVRTSFDIFGASAWSCRLPFLLAFLVFTALIFSFVSRLLSPLFGLTATLILWISPYSHLATEARSYAMVLCFTAMMLVGWYRIIEAENSTRWWAFATLAAGGIGLLLSHVLGVLAYCSFFAVEAVRLWIRRRPDWCLWAALLIPLPSVLAYLPLIRLRSDILFSPWSQASPRRLAICYWEHLRFLVTPFVLIGAIALAWPWLSQRRNTADRSSSSAAALSLRWLLLFLVLVPLEVHILFARTGTAFYERYGSVALIPFALLPVIFLGRRTGCDRRAAGCMSMVLAGLLVFNTSGRAWLTEQLAAIAPPRVAARIEYLVALPPIAPAPLNLPAVPTYLEKEVRAAPSIAHLEHVDPELPLVAGTGPTFLELDRYQDTSLADRLYLLTNHEAASMLAHNTVFEHYDLAKPAFPIRGHVESYCAFLREHSQFLVLGGYNYPDTWLLRKLELDGATFHILGTYDDGVVEEHQIYRVSAEKTRCRELLR